MNVYRDIIGSQLVDKHLNILGIITDQYVEDNKLYLVVDDNFELCPRGLVECLDIMGIDHKINPRLMPSFIKLTD
jgi:hypothetical protein